MLVWSPTSLLLFLKQCFRKYIKNVQGQDFQKPFDCLNVHKRELHLLTYSMLCYVTYVMIVQLLSDV